MRYSHKQIVLASGLAVIAIIVAIRLGVYRDQSSPLSTDQAARPDARDTFSKFGQRPNSSTTEPFVPTRNGKLSLDDADRLRTMRLDPEEARLLLERAKSEIQGTRERALVSAIIIGALCQQGYPEEAWNLLETEEGIVRESEVDSFFSGSKQPITDLLGKLGELYDKDERSRAWHGLVSARPLEFLNLAHDRIEFRTPAEKTLAISALEFSLQSALDDAAAKALLEGSFRLIGSGVLDAKDLMTILNYADKVPAFEKWEISNSNRTKFKTEDLEQVRKMIVPQMINANTTAAMELITKNPSTKYSYPVISAAVARMYRNSPTEANSWLNNNLDGLDPATGQRIISCVAQEAIRSGEFSTAEQWAGRILNADVRNELLKQSAEQQAKVETGK